MYLVLALNRHCRVLIIHSKTNGNFMGTYEKIMRPWFDSWVGKIHQRRDRLPTPVLLVFPCGSAGKESACNAGDLGLITGWEDPLEKGRLHTLVFWPGEFLGLYSPWGRKESD